MTFPSAFNIYWISSSSVQLAILTAFRQDNFRHWMGVPDFLPGSKLERQNMGLKKGASNTGQQKIFSQKPKTLRQKGQVALADKSKSSSN